jgi:8-amino-7-oxononanoate synthase
MQHTFRHNCLQDLEDKLKRLAATNIVIVVESIYSMDGDAAPLTRIFDLALRYNACVVVDEAHGLGVCGSTGLGLLHSCKLQHHPSLLCSIFTFGKAAGCHGAVVCSSSKQWIQFLYNYGRPIVYSTSLPLHALVSIDCAYMTMTSKQGNQLRQQLQANVDLFRDLIQQHVMTRHANLSNIALVESYSPIQALIIPNNHDCVDFCNRLHQKSQRSIKLFPIRSPTVPKGMERVRVVVHAHNSRNEILHLVRLMQHTLEEMKLIHGTSVQPQNATVHSRL